MEDKLTVQQAYAAMYWYLSNLYEATRSDELGGLLGGMSLLSDNKPADPAIWDDWLKAVEKATGGEASIGIDLQE